MWSSVGYFLTVLSKLSSKRNFLHAHGPSSQRRFLFGALGPLKITADEADSGTEECGFSNSGFSALIGWTQSQDKGERCAAAEDFKVTR